MGNQVVNLPTEIQRAPAGPARDRALAKAEDALDRITRF